MTEQEKAHLENQVSDLQQQLATLRQQLLACEASRERLKGWLQINHKWHLDYDDEGGYADSALCDKNLKALRESPSTALAEYLREKLEPACKALERLVHIKEADTVIAMLTALGKEKA